MSELLTHEEYKAIADGLTLASTSFVDGGFRKAASGATIDSVNPATGSLLAKSPPAVKMMWISPSARRVKPLMTDAGAVFTRPNARRC